MAYFGSTIPEMIVPMVVSKLFGAVVSLVMSILSADMFVRKGEQALAEMLAKKGKGKPPAKPEAAAAGPAQDAESSRDVL